MEKTIEEIFLEEREKLLTEVNEAVERKKVEIKKASEETQYRKRRY